MGGPTEKVMSPQKPEVRGCGTWYLGEHTASRGKGKCKGPKAGPWLKCSHSKEADKVGMDGGGESGGRRGWGGEQTRRNAEALLSFHSEKDRDHREMRAEMAAMTDSRFTGAVR